MVRETAPRSVPHPVVTEGRPMSVRKKTLLIVVCVMAFLVFVVLPMNLLLVMRNLHELERKEVVKAVERARAAIHHQLEQLSRVVRDWAFWDDTYDYVLTRDKAYEESNLAAVTFLSLGIDYFILRDMGGGTVFAVQVDQESGELIPPQPEFIQSLTSFGLAGSPEIGKAGLSAVFLVQGIPYLVSLMPVLTTQGEGPPRGSLIMARSMDVEILTWIETVVGADVSILPAGDSRIPPGSGDFFFQQLEEGGIPISTEGISRIHGYALLDSLGEDPLVLQVSLPRDIFRVALNSTHLLFGSLVTSALLVILGAFIAVNALFVRPLERMTEALRMGRGRPSLKSLVGRKRRDEIATLAGTIEEALAERERSERRLQAILENSQDVIALFSETGRFLYLNPRAREVLGYREEELVNREVIDFIHTEDLPAFMRMARALMDYPGRPVQADLRFLRPDGTWVHLEVIGVGLHQDPHLRGVLVTAHDVTDRVKAHQVLESINALLLGFGPDVMDNMYSILRASREMLGAEKAMYVRRVKEGYAVLSTEDGDAGLSLIREDQENPLLKRREMAEGLPLMMDDVPRELREDSLLRGASSVIGFPVRSRDKHVGHLLLLDQKARRWQDEELRTLEVLGKAMAVEEELLSWEEGIKEFMDIASHELRHPITLMKGYALTLLTKFERLDEATRREMLQVINQGADRLETLVSELLDLTRIERGRFEVKKKAIDPRPLLARAVDEMRDRTPSRDLILSLGGHLAPRRIDEERILQVLVILLDNAVKYSPEGTPVEVTAEDTSEGLMISVLDRGPGIPQDKRDLVFQRFYQVEQVLHHSKPGLGLGLYIAREIVEAHGGRIWNEPREGGGTVFRFLLP